MSLNANRGKMWRAGMETAESEREREKLKVFHYISLPSTVFVALFLFYFFLCSSRAVLKMFLLVFMLFWKGK